jgi:hypothetical protein
MEENKMRLKTTVLILCMCLSGKLFSQQPAALNEFVIVPYEGPENLFYKSEGCTPNDGVIVFYSAIPDLKFTMSNNPARLKNKPDFDPTSKRYVLCVQPTDSEIGGISRYNIEITAEGFKEELFEISGVRAATPQYYKIDPKESEQARLGRQKREEAERKAEQERLLREEAERKRKLAEQQARQSQGYNEDNRKFRLGLFGGMVMADQTSNSWIYDDKKSALFGYNVGMLFEFKLSRYISFQPEFLFVQKGSKGRAYTSDGYVYTETGDYIPDVLVESTVQVHYLEVPFNLILNMPTGRNGAFFLGAGFSVSYGLSGKITLDPSKDDLTFYLSDDEKEEDAFGGDEPLFNRFDYGMNFLIGYRYERIFARVGYNLGLPNIANGSETDGWAKFTNSYYNVSIGVKF